jgi:hypothetical protein
MSSFLPAPMGPQLFYSLFEMIPEIKTDLKDK